MMPLPIDTPRLTVHEGRSAIIPSWAVLVFDCLHHAILAIRGGWQYATILHVAWGLLSCDADRVGWRSYHYGISDSLHGGLEGQVLQVCLAPWHRWTAGVSKLPHNALTEVGATQIQCAQGTWTHALIQDWQLGWCRYGLSSMGTNLGVNPAHGSLTGEAQPSRSSETRLLDTRSRGCQLLRH